MLFKRKFLSIIVLLLFLLSLAGCSTTKKQSEAPASTPTTTTNAPENKNLILATTTSVQDSGLLDVLIPEFEKETGYIVKTVAVGSGAAIEMGQKGEADALLVHSPADEKKIVDSGAVINYQLLAHNGFIIIGPENDPAKIKGTKSAVEAMKKIYDSKSLFVSRGDNSGTQKAELKLWTAAGVTPKKGTASYQETGQGMGQTLTVTNQKSGYTLSDKATYLAQKKNLKLVIMVEGDKSLMNIYHVMQVNPEQFPKVNSKAAKAFVDFMVSPAAQDMIAKFGVDKYGEVLFYADAGKNVADLGK